MDWIQQWQSKLNKQNGVTPLVRTGGSRHTGLAALPHRNIHIEVESVERYRRQLETYAYLVEEKIGKKVSKMHLYYTGEENGIPTITFAKSSDSIDSTIKEFDKVVAKIQSKDFTGRAKDKNLCANCDMRYFCKRYEKR